MGRPLRQFCGYFWLSASHQNKLFPERIQTCNLIVLLMIQNCREMATHLSKHWTQNQVKIALQRLERLSCKPTPLDILLYSFGMPNLWNLNRKCTKRDVNLQWYVKGSSETLLIKLKWGKLIGWKPSPRLRFAREKINFAPNSKSLIFRFEVASLRVSYGDLSWSFDKIRCIQENLWTCLRLPSLMF